MSGQRKALIIANDTYTQKALRDLRAPAADAEALRRVLADPQIGDFAVQVVRNESAHVIAAQIEDLFSESRPDDLLLMHFSGHGLKSESGELFSRLPIPGRIGSVRRRWRLTFCSGACGIAGRAASCCCWTAAIAVPSPEVSRSAQPETLTSLTAFRGEGRAEDVAGR